MIDKRSKGQRNQKRKVQRSHSFSFIHKTLQVKYDNKSQTTCLRCSGSWSTSRKRSGLLRESSEGLHLLIFWCVLQFNRKQRLEYSVAPKSGGKASRRNGIKRLTWTRRCVSSTRICLLSQSSPLLEPKRGLGPATRRKNTDHPVKWSSDWEAPERSLKAAEKKSYNYPKHPWSETCEARNVSLKYQHTATWLISFTFYWNRNMKTNISHLKQSVQNI